MTHSHDKTFLASLGFSDPDKRDQMHDLACEFLSQSAQRERIARYVTGVEPSVLTESSSSVEVAISKGEGQHKTTIGFLDVRIDFTRSDLNGSLSSVFLEVKISRVSIGDILRQINLYRQYQFSPFGVLRQRLRALHGDDQVNRSFWVVATAFDISAGEMETLRQANISHIRLGSGFAKWFEERQKQPAPKSEEF